MFNENSKRMIDNIVPIAGTVALWHYYLKPQKMKVQDMIMYLVIGFLALYLITSSITKNILRSSLEAKSKALEVADKQYAQGGSTPGIGAVTVNTTQWSNELHQDISGLRMPFVDNTGGLYTRLAALSSDNLAAVARQYQSDWGESLYNAMKGESYPNMIGGVQDTVNGILNRLKNLGL